MSVHVVESTTLRTSQPRFFVCLKAQEERLGSRRRTGVDEPDDRLPARERPGPDLEALADIDVRRHPRLRRRVGCLVAREAVGRVDLPRPRHAPAHIKISRRNVGPSKNTWTFRAKTSQRREESGDVRGALAAAAGAAIRSAIGGIVASDRRDRDVGPAGDELAVAGEVPQLVQQRAAGTSNHRGDQTI